MHIYMQEIAQIVVLNVQRTAKMGTLTVTQGTKNIWRPIITHNLQWMLTLTMIIT